MKIAITGGTGFVGRHLARRLAAGGHQVVLIARGEDRRDESVRHLPGVRLVSGSVSQPERLREAFQGCDAVAHCAGINRELGSQTYERVHVQGTQNVVDAAKTSGVAKILLLSFLRARPNCGSGYHESKWRAEEIVRSSGLDYTVVKAGVIYGQGDHMLDHISRAVFTFPLFALVGWRDRWVRPLAVEDLVTVLEAALIGGRLSRQTIAVLGPEEISLSAAVRRVAAAAEKMPFFVRAPVFFHYVLGWFLERLMRVPLVSLAQVRILSEGIVEPSHVSHPLPSDLAPATAFSPAQIKNGLPDPGGFTREDLRCSRQEFAGGGA